MAVEWLALGTAVARITLRAVALAEAPIDWSTVADQVVDAEGGLAAVRRWMGGRTAGQAEDQLGQAIGRRLKAVVMAEFGDLARAGSVSDDATAACTTAASVIDGLMRGTGMATTLTAALAHPDQLYEYALSHGGADRRRRDLPAGVAERVYDRALRAACTELARYAPTAAAAVPYALGELLRRSEEDQQQLEQVLEVTRDTRAMVGELSGAAGQHQAHTLRSQLDALQLPPFLHDELAELIDRSPGLLQLGEVLSSDPAPARTLTRWVSQPPPFLTAGPTAGWVLLAHALQAHQAGAAAAEAFRAAIKAGAAHAEHLAAQAALTLLPDPERGSDLDELLSDNPDPLAAWIRAARADNWSAAHEAAGQLPEATPRERERKAMVLAETHRRLGDPTRSIQVLQSAAPCSIGTGAITELARLLLQEALRGRRPSRSSALLAALDFAVQARDQRRRWRGDSVDPTLIAFAAAWHNGDQRQAALLVTAEPQGSAIPAEVADPRTRTARAIAAARQGDVGTAEQLADGLDGFPRARVLAEIESMGDRPRTTTAAKLWRAAWDVATDDEELLLAAQGLLMSGATVAALAELRTRQPDAMAELDQLAEVRRQPGESVRQHATRLAARQTTNVYAAAELGWLQAEAGRTRQAANTLSGAADQFDDQHWRLEAAAMLVRAGDVQAAGKTAEAAIAKSGDRWPGQLRARYICLDCAFARRDWPAVIAHARQLLDLTEDPEIRWALAQGLAATDDHAAAWELLRAPEVTLPLPPTGRTHRQNTHLRLRLLSRYGTRRDLVAGAVEALRVYSGDEKLAGAIVALVLTAGASRPDWGEPAPSPDGAEPETEELREQIRRFTQDFPDSPYLRPVNLGDPADPEQLRDALRPLLQNRSAAIGDLDAQIARGELPAGILADATNRHYAELLILRADEGQVARLADPTIDEVETATAQTVLESTAEVMIEASALLTTSYLADPHRDACYATVKTLITTADVIADLDASAKALGLRTTTTLGWDPILDAPVRIEVDPEVADARARKADELLALARAHTLPLDLTVDPVHPDLDAPAWLNLVQICKDTGAALWCDDAFLRILARAEGIATFGTVALLAHLRGVGNLTADDLDQALTDLLRSRVVDLPVTEERLRTIASGEDWQPATAALAISRPAAWRGSASACIATVFEACQRKAFDSVALATWYAAAADGITGLQLGPQSTANLLAGLLAAILMLPSTTAPAVAALVPTARQLASIHGLPDMWPPAIQEVHRMLLHRYDEPSARMIILALIAGLSPTDKSIAITIMINPLRDLPVGRTPRPPN